MDDTHEMIFSSHFNIAWIIERMGLDGAPRPASGKPAVPAIFGGVRTPRLSSPSLKPCAQMACAAWDRWRADFHAYDHEGTTRTYKQQAQPISRCYRSILVASHTKRKAGPASRHNWSAYQRRYGIISTFSSPYLLLAGAT